MEAGYDWKRLKFQRPAFHPDDLRLVGDMLSDPVTRAIRNDAFGFEGPDWSEGRLALVSLGEILSNALAMAIRRGALSFQEPPDWSEGLSDMYRVFGLDCRQHQRHHLFRAEPVDWGEKVEFTEPQFTKGLAHFLHVPERETRIRRVHALLKALGVETEPGIELPKEGREAVVTPEYTFGKHTKKRIDLLIDWTDSSKRIIVAVEAKLDHNVTKGQLAAYRKHCRSKFNDKNEYPLFRVVSRKPTKNIRKSLTDNKDWRWIAWRGLLIAHERALSDDYDDDAYSQFRRTLWERTG